MNTAIVALRVIADREWKNGYLIEFARLALAGVLDWDLTDVPPEKRGKYTEDIQVGQRIICEEFGGCIVLALYPDGILLVASLTDDSEHEVWEGDLL